MDYKKVLNNAEDMVDQSPDSALMLLNEIPLPRSLKDEVRARYGWIKGLAHDKKNQSLTHDSLLVYSLDFFKSRQNTTKLPSLYKLAAKYYYEQKEYDKSDGILNEGIEWAKTQNDSVLISGFYYLRAYLIFRQDRTSNKAEMYFRKSLQYKETPAAYYMLMDFSKEDSVVYYGEKAVESALNNSDTVSAVFYLRNMASHMSQRRQDEEAGKMLHYALFLSPVDLGTLLTMTYQQLDLGRVDSAEYYLNKTKESILQLKEQGYSITSSTENAMATVQRIINYSHDRKLDNTINRYNDSIFLATHDQYKKLQANLESNYNLEKENMQLTIRQQQTQLWLMTIILFILIFGGITCLYINKRKQKLLEAEEKIETLNHLLKDAIESRNEEIDSRFFKKILLQQLGLIRLVAAAPTSANQELLKQIANISNNETPTDTLLAWDDLYPIIDSIHNNFHFKLIESYGNILIEKEIQLCCLLCANFSTKEIQVVTQQSIPTIYQRKTSIRKKIGIGEKEDIILFLNQQFQG